MEGGYIRILIISKIIYSACVLYLCLLCFTPLFHSLISPHLQTPSKQPSARFQVSPTLSHTNSVDNVPASPNTLKMQQVCANEAKGGAIYASIFYVKSF